LSILVNYWAALSFVNFSYLFILLLPLKILLSPSVLLLNFTKTDWALAVIYFLNLPYQYFFVSVFFYLAQNIRKHRN